MKNIRNFSIIAHINHGKSTLADRIIELCGGLSNREMKEQVLDSMDIEKERGITIKAQTVALKYQAENDKIYNLNLIDTPGHVDFSYEVSRSLCACEGALLVIDASQGVEAQTVANCYTALALGVEIIPVLNKIDIPSCINNLEKIKKEIEDIICIDATNIITCSAKTGIGIKNVLETLINKLPCPSGNPSAPLQALIIDSWFDNYVGVVILVRIVNGTLQPKDKILLMATGCQYLTESIGVFTPKSQLRTTLTAGQVGFIIAGIKELNAAKVGDTITSIENQATTVLPGFKEIQPQVFAGLFPIETSQYNDLNNSLEKLKLNDAAFQYESEFSQALGLGFRCGFLGLLHMEIVQERLEREFNINLITTIPTVIYEIVQCDNVVLRIDNPSKLPELFKLREIREPIVTVNLYMPQNCVGSVMKLCIQKRGVPINMNYLGKQVQLIYEIPMAEIVLDFFDRLKSISHGYASMEYKFKEYRTVDVVKVDILINGEKIDALSFIMHRTQSQHRGRAIVTKMCNIIPRQMFDVTIQAAIGSTIISRENIKAMRKNVVAKCYGGDVSRKRKLLEKQKIGKKRMKQIGSIEIPQEAFLAILKIEEK